MEIYTNLVLLESDLATSVMIKVHKGLTQMPRFLLEEAEHVYCFRTVAEN